MATAARAQAAHGCDRGLGPLPGQVDVGEHARERGTGLGEQQYGGLQRRVEEQDVGCGARCVGQVRAELRLPHLNKRDETQGRSVLPPSLLETSVDLGRGHGAATHVRGPLVSQGRHHVTGHGDAERRVAGLVRPHELVGRVRAGALRPHVQVQVPVGRTRPHRREQCHPCEARLVPGTRAQ